MVKIGRLRSLRFGPLAAAGALALLLASAAAQPAAAEPRLGQIAGEVEIGRGEPPRWFPARPGEVLRAGDSVRTGRGARAEVDLGTGTVRLFEGSLLRLPPEAMRPEGPSAVGLERGDSLFEVRPRKPGDPFEVRTPEVVASVKGTRFAVQLAGDGAAVSVFTGLVGVRGPKASLETEVLVRSGFAALGGAARPFELSLQSSVDPWQRWQDGAPPPPVPASPSAARERNDVEEAKQAALRAVAPEVLEATGTTIVARPDNTDVDGSEDGNGNGKGKGDGAAPPASMAPDGAAAIGLLDSDAVPDTDPVSLGLKNGLARGVKEQVAESVLNGVATAPDLAGGSVTTPGGGGVTPGSGVVTTPTIPLTLEVVKSGGPNRVVVSGPSGTLAQLTEKQIETILETGNTSLLGPALLQALSANNANALTFTQTLEDAL